MGNILRSRWKLIGKKEDNVCDVETRELQIFLKYEFCKKRKLKSYLIIVEHNRSVDGKLEIFFRMDQIYSTRCDQKLSDCCIVRYAE